MIRNYIKTALRIMLRQKAYSSINIAGLSIGIAASLLIILYVADELSFDRFHKDGDRIYRVGFNVLLQGNESLMVTSPAPVAAALMAEAPEVESVVRFGLWRTASMGYEDKIFTEKDFLVADSNFFEFFSFPLISGDPKTALKGVDKIVLSETAAKRYFGNEDPIGKIILRGSNKVATEITGVAKDAPTNSHIQFSMILSAPSWDYLRDNHQWTSNNSYTYLRVLPGADILQVKKRLDHMVETHMGAELEKFLGMSFKQFRASGNDVGLFTQPMLDIHLKSDHREEIGPNGNLQYLYIFGAIAIFILLIACINFMNLSTARSANRAKEVGVRKAIGALRTRLIGQFISESMLYSFFSTVVALLLMWLFLAPFNFLAGKTLTLALFANPILIVGIFLFALVVGLVAGSYPAFYLTSFKPVEVLKGKIRSGMKNSGLRNALVIFQFWISISLILGSLVVNKQLNYMQEKNMGFDKENVIRLVPTWSLNKNAKPFKDELLSHSEFKGVSFVSGMPPHITWSNAYRKVGTEQDFLLNVCVVDYDNLDVMGYTLAQGRFFSRDHATDSSGVVFNEAAFKLMGFTEVENQLVNDYSGGDGKVPRPLHIIGVVKDFNFESLRNTVKPMAIRLHDDNNGEIGIRLSPGNVSGQLKLLETIWKKHSTNAFEYTFLDQDFDQLFRAEQRISRIVLVLTLLTIFIACLGLFGLATYVGEQRAKEISIRKVMGASILQVMGLLFKDFTLLIIIAFAIAAPLGWYLMNSWLESFAFRVNVDAWIVVLSGFAALLIATFTISFQSIKAARENPVNALKSE